MIDTHAHLDEIEELPRVLESAVKAGVAAIIAVGSDMKSNQAVLDISRRHPGFVFPAIGLHPWNLRAESLQTELDFITEHVAEAVALGEIGLDYSKRVLSLNSKGMQKEALLQILNIAASTGKPALLHSRYAWRDCLEMARGSHVEKAVFHWYTGPSGVLKDILASGYYLSATPALDYHEEHRRAIRETPADRLLLETDSPVVYARGRQGEFEARPYDVRRSLEAASFLKQIQPEELAAMTASNAVRLFGLSLEDGVAGQ